jgi:hypothetical protein
MSRAGESGVQSLGRGKKAPKCVRVQSTLSRSEARPTLVPPAHHATSSRNTATLSSQSLNPDTIRENPSSTSSKPAGRLTLRPTRQPDSSSRPADGTAVAATPTAPQEMVEDRAAFEPGRSGTGGPAPRSYVPKPKIKPLYPDSASSKTATKKPIVPDRPLSPLLRLCEPEEGDWEGGGHAWKRKAVSPEGGQPLDGRLCELDCALLLPRIG